MADAQFFANELERDAKTALARAGHLLATAQTLRSLPMANAPTAEMRHYLGGLGFCVIAFDALAYAAHVLANTEPPADDGLMLHATGHSEHDQALLAIQEAIRVTSAARNKA